MPVAVITPPEPFVSLAQAKRQCRATGFTDDDDYLTDMVATACAWLDAPGWLGRALGLQTLELRLTSFFAQDWSYGLDWTCWDDDQQWARWAVPGRFMSLELPFPPLVSITSITYEDCDGIDQVLDASGWNVTEQDVQPAFGDVWPAGRIDADAVRIRYQAGYVPIPPATEGADPTSTVPRPIQHAALLLVSHWYNHPDAVVGVEARDSSTEMPLGVADLLSAFRVYG